MTTTVQQVIETCGTKERLLDAAERLIAEVGPEALSLRRVTEDAGCNVAAIHYHFGNKLSLVRAALARRTAAQNERRLQLLTSLADDSTLFDLVRAIVTPLVEFVYSEHQQTYVEFLRMLERAGGEWRDAILETNHLYSDLLNAEYRRLLPHLTIDTVLVRGQVGRVVAFEVLANPARFYGYEPTPDEVIETLVQLVVAALTVPDGGQRTDQPVPDI